MVKKLIYTSCVAIALATTSCTLNDDTPASNAPADKYLLTDVRVAGVIGVLKFEYDSYNRLISLDYAGDETYTITYDGMSKNPSQVDNKLYSTYRPDPYSDLEERYVSEQTIWRNIKTDAAGHIIQAHITERSWYDRPVDRVDGDGFHYTGYEIVEEESDSWTENIRYDSEGHFIGTDEVHVTWKDGLMTLWRDSEGCSTTFEYCDAENTSGQWDPTIPFIGPIQVTGWFGVAPKKHFKGFRMTEDGHVTDVVSISYRLGSNGLIKAARYDSERGDDYSYPGVVTFNYKKIR